MENFYIPVFLLHLVFLMAVFDIYFRSPLIEGLDVVENSVETGVKRVVLFVGDGLRADTFFSYRDNVTQVPFLREKIVSGKAAWCVSHSRVPTESRPGHVALLGGIYEDPSAVFKGWKANPTPFDSVINQSRLSFSWGSPDIIPMFKDNNQDHIFYETYSAELQDFSSNESHKLNTWVYDKVKIFFDTAKRNQTLAKSLRADKIIYFLHFLGIDVSGHADKPDSKEYRYNVRVTDEIVKNVEKLFNDHFSDQGTAFIFTSDHGMTSWGSHGAGSPIETETPFVAWGAGINPTICTTDSPSCGPYESNIPSHCFKDINQADIAVLMSILLGVPIPTNSVGKLPVDFLSFNASAKYKAFSLNAKQLLEKYLKRREQVKNSLSDLFFNEFSPLTHLEREKRFFSANLDMVNGAHQQAISKMESIINLALEGLTFYETYYEKYLLVLISISFLGQIVNILLELVPNNNIKLPYFQTTPFINRAYFVILLFVLQLFFVQKLPLHYVIYNVIPLLLWWRVTLMCKAIGFQELYKLINWTNLFHAVVYSVGIQILVWSFFSRQFLSYGMIMISFWPWYNRDFKAISNTYSRFWVFVSWILAIFPALPTVQNSSIRIELIMFTGFLWFVAGTTIILNKSYNMIASYKALSIQVLFIIPTLLNIYTVSKSIESGHGLPEVCQILSFCFLGVYSILLVSGPITILGRFIGISFSLGVMFLLFCTSHEALFPFIFSSHLSLWIMLEFLIHLKKPRHAIPRSLISSRPHDFRKAFFYVFYIIYSFFAIGNIDSINSFDTNWVRCFITVFSPFTMMSLILVKTIIPFLLVSCAFRFVVLITGASTRTIFLIALLFLEVMGLEFLFMVKNKGSWLDIGKSLSHYIIVEVMILFLIVLYELSSFITLKKIKYKNLSLHVLPKWRFD